MCFDKHVRSITKTAFFHLRNIAKIRPMLSAADTETLIYAFISSRLVQNAAASGTGLLLLPKVKKEIGWT